MACRHCGSALERPGDFCLVCRERSVDDVVLAVSPDRATLTMLSGEEILGETTITTVPEDGDAEAVQRRNYAELVVDEIRRKRPESVYATGHRPVIRAIRDRLRYPIYRVDAEDPVQTVLDRRGDRALDVVDLNPAEKIGGSHTTVIGGRDGMRAVLTVAEHPHIKKVIPGPIDAGGVGSQSGLRAKVTRADDGGNLRLLLRDGSSVQENRLVTTARDREMGERVGDDCNEILEESSFQ